VGVSPKEVRQAAATEAVRLLERVAAGEFNIEEPEVATDEITSAPTPTITAHHRRFSWREEEGI